MERKLTPKQQRFVEEYLIDLNATQAAIRAGYSPQTASEQSARLLGNVSVKSAIDRALAERSRRTGINAALVLEELALLARADMADCVNPDGSVKSLHVMSPEARRAIAEYRIQGDKATIKLHDKARALNLLAQHLGLLIERHEHTGKGGGPIQFEEILPPSEVDRLLRELESPPGGESV